MILEVLLDRAAHDLGLDPATVRARNLLLPGDSLRTTVTGAEYDPGDYPAVLDALLAAVDYDGARAEQHRIRRSGHGVARGVGISTVLDSTAWFAREEPARVTVHASGAVSVACGTAAAGQRHERAFATIVAEVLPVAADSVVVAEGDTADLETSGGTSGSRSLQLAGTAVRRAAELVWDQARRIAARMLEANVDDVAVEHGRIAVRGVPARGLSLAEVAARAEAEGSTLDACSTIEQAGATYTAAAHCSIVDVDLETGRVTPRRHVTVTDCGRVVDPASASGQVVGATAQGIAQALFEEFRTDEQGIPRTATLLDYLVPAAPDLPAIEAHFLSTPTPRNPLGARGVGEVGMVGAPPAVYAAVIDALRPLGVEAVEFPCTPERVWAALRDAGTAVAHPRRRS